MEAKGMIVELALAGDILPVRSVRQGKATVSTSLWYPHRVIGRNDPCPCGSGRKFKKCCLH